VTSPVGLVQGPDGLLYYISISTGQIRRIVWRGVTAAASATPWAGYSPLTVNFSSAGSQSPGGGALSYQWDFGDGSTSAEPNPSHTYTSATVHTFVATLTVTSPRGSNSSTVDITVGSLPPVPTITSPGGALSVRPGQTVNFAGGATDAEDGAIPADRLNWTVLLHHCYAPTDCHIHTVEDYAGVASGTFLAPDHEDLAQIELQLTAKDSGGLQDTASVLIGPVTTMLSLRSDPPARSWRWIPAV